jgi:hypothetical protein
MSVQVYYLAAVAREKLLSEAGCKDHNLHRIVHHSQLYDTLLLQYYDEEDRLEKGKTQRYEIAKTTSKHCRQLDPISENGDDNTTYVVLSPSGYDSGNEKDFSLTTSDANATVSVCEVDDSEP